MAPYVLFRIAPVQGAARYLNTDVRRPAALARKLFFGWRATRP